MKEREKFGSRLGFILVSAGCAVGLGNVWKFPYICGENGGAAFVLIYLVFLAILGFPIMCAEFTVGRGSGKGAARAFEELETKESKWHHFKWVYPVHEVLECDKDITENEICHCENIVLRHFPDDTKSRGQYLDLLKLSVAEHQESDRNTHYLAREYMFAGEYPSAIKYFKKHLNPPTATWKEERSASYRYIGDCYLYQNKQSLAKQFYKKSICESPITREGYLALAKLLYNQKKYFDCYITLKAMLDITARNLTYISSPECWDETAYDLLSLCSHYLNMPEEAYKYCSLALLQNPQDKRLTDNLQYFRSLL